MDSLTAPAAPRQAADVNALDPRRFATLGQADHGWLKARHHFSFASYHDPARMQWGAIRVWNDDEIAPQSGFPMHSHADMEIITYVRDGAITHRDSLGNEGRTEAGDVQVMSAGSGVTHSEMNLEDTTCRLFQIWVHPRERGVAPRWDQRCFAPDRPEGRPESGFVPLASGYGEPGALMIHADARVLGARLAAGERLDHRLPADQLGYLVLARGAARIGEATLAARDGLAIPLGAALPIAAIDDCEIVLVEARA